MSMLKGKRVSNTSINMKTFNENSANKKSSMIFGFE